MGFVGVFVVVFGGGYFFWLLAAPQYCLFWNDSFLFFPGVVFVKLQVYPEEVYNLKQVKS